jgi:parallel beta-helix repeat protein
MEANSVPACRMPVASVRRTRSFCLLMGLPLTLGVWGSIAACRSPSAPLTAEGRTLAAPAAAGPQAGAINIPVGANIQSAVDGHRGDSVFCLKAGVHAIANAITPKTGNVFVGEFGAILDGTGWVTTDPNQAAFRAHNQDVDNVTVRNLVIRNMPQKGIHAYKDFSDNWTVEYCEITRCLTGIQMGNSSRVRHNLIRHNSVGGYSNYRGQNTTWESNEIAYNGSEQKIVEGSDVKFRGNWVHHNAQDGIWYDTDCTGALIEDNLVEDNGREGIFYEISARGVIRNNTIRRSPGSGIFISTSKDMEITNNTLEDNFRGIQYFLDCGTVGGGRIGFDLSNNRAHDNTVMVGTKHGAYANGLAYISSCTATQIAPYLNGSKNLAFRNTRYVVPDRSGRYWFWGLSGLSSWRSWAWGVSSLKSWSEWQAIGHDTTGVVTP